MTKVLRRLAAVIVIGLAPLAVVTVATPAVSSAECEPGRTWDPMTRLCDPPPPVPVWYQAAPTYAQPWAPAWAPPPPPPSPWPNIVPVWDPRSNAWIWMDPR